MLRICLFVCPYGSSKYENHRNYELLMQTQTATGLTGGENLRSQIIWKDDWERRNSKRFCA